MNKMINNKNLKLKFLGKQQLIFEISKETRLAKFT